MKSSAGTSAGEWLVVGHYGADNVGDEAMLAGAIALAQGAPLVVTSKKTAPWSTTPGVAVRFVPFRPIQIVREAMRCEGVVVGGGTHHHDDFHGFRFLRHLRYMAFFSVVSAIIRKRKRPVLWLGVGVGPISRTITKLVTRLGVRSCDAILVRDMASYHEVRRLWARAPVLKAFDLAPLSLMVGGKEEVAAKQILGIAPTDFAPRSPAERDRAECFWDDLCFALGSALTRDPSLEVRLFTFSPGRRESDTRIVSEIARSLSAFGERVKVEAVEIDPHLVYARVKRCTHFLAARYHSAVFAYLAERPTAVIAYHRKLFDFAEEVRIRPDSVIDPRGASRRDIETLLQSLLSDSSAPVVPPRDKAIESLLNRDVFRLYFEGPAP